MDQSSQKALSSYRKEQRTFLEKAKNADKIKYKYEHDAIISNKEQPMQKMDVTDSSTISDKNEFSDKENKVIALASFPGSGNTWLRYCILCLNLVCMSSNQMIIYVLHTDTFYNKLQEYIQAVYIKTMVYSRVAFLLKVYPILPYSLLKLTNLDRHHGRDSENLFFLYEIQQRPF